MLSFMVPNIVGSQFARSHSLPCHTVGHIGGLATMCGGSCHGVVLPRPNVLLHLEPDERSPPAFDGKLAEVTLATTTTTPGADGCLFDVDGSSVP